MKYVEDATRVNGRDCIKFVPYTNEQSWVRVFPGAGCYSYVGRFSEFLNSQYDDLDGSQDLSLAKPGCLNNAIVAHEFMHALGSYY